MTNQEFVDKLGQVQTKMEEFGDKAKGHGMTDWYYDNGHFFIQIDDSYSQCCSDSRTEIIGALEFLEKDVETIVKDIEEREKEEKRIREEKLKEEQERLKEQKRVLLEKFDIEQYKRLKAKFEGNDNV